MNCKFANRFLICILLLLSPLSAMGETPFYDLGSPNNTMRAASNNNPVNLPAGWLIGGVPIGTGASIRSGTGAPAAGLGNNGDFYIDKSPSPPNLYGPKTAGAWGSSTALGSAGPAGQGVPVGGTAGQVLSKINSTDFNTQWITTSGTGTVTSITVAVGTSGTDIAVSNATVTTSGTITLNIPTASAANRGALLAADWTNFNSKLAPNGNGSALTGLLFNQLGGRVADTQVDQNSVAPSFHTETDGATITVTCDPNKTVQNSTVTLAGNRTLAFSSSAGGMSGVLIVKQDVTGSRTLTLPAGSKVINGGGGVITLTTTANAIDVLSWTYDGTNYLWTYGKNFN